MRNPKSLNDILNYKEPRTYGLWYIAHPMFIIVSFIVSIILIFKATNPTHIELLTYGILVIVLLWVIAAMVFVSLVIEPIQRAIQYLHTLSISELEYLMQHAPEGHPLGDDIESIWKKRKKEEYGKTLVSPRRTSK